MSNTSYNELLSRAKIKHEAYLKVHEDIRQIGNISQEDIEQLEHALYLELCEQALVRPYD